MPATTQALSLNKGRYSVEQELQHGSKRSLFQAYDLEKEAAVSIFEVPASLPKVATSAHRAALAESFLEDAARLAKFRHRTVIGINDFFIESGRHYVVSDPVDGSDLASMIKAQAKLFPLADVIGWADSVLDALNNLHTYRPQLIHGNVRPDNIFISGDGTARLVLSGIMASETQGVGSSFALGSGSTVCYSPLEKIWETLDVASQKVILGQYDEASEKALKQEADCRSDIYSLGATLYQLTTGRRPQDALERSIEMIEGNSDPLLPPSQVEASVPVEVSDVVMKALELKREYRFDSAAIMRQVLKTALIRAKERGAEISESSNSARDATNDLSVPGTENLPADTDILRSDAPNRPTPPPVPNSVAAIFEGAELEDDLLGILTEEPTANSVAAKKENPSEKVVEQKKNDELGESTEAVTLVESAAETHSAAWPDSDEERAEVVDEDVVAAGSAVKSVSDEPAADTSEPMAKAAVASHSSAATQTETDYAIFSEQPDSKGKLPMIIAAAVFLCLAAAGGWFFLSKAEKSQQQQPVVEAVTPAEQVQPPVETAARPEPQPEPPANTASMDEQPAADLAAEVPVQAQKNSKTPPQAAKAKRQPADAKPAKKAVTVDDLINDN